MIKEIKTKEEKQNKRVTRIIAALFVAGAIILIAAYVPSVFKRTENNQNAESFADRVEKTTRTFSGTIGEIDYENHSFALAIDPNPALYEGQDETIFVTKKEVDASPWNIVSNFDEDLGPSTQITKVTPGEGSEENPQVISSALSFDELKEGDYVYVLFWPENYFFELKRVTPVLIILAPPPGVQ